MPPLLNPEGDFQRELPSWNDALSVFCEQLCKQERKGEGSKQLLPLVENDFKVVSPKFLPDNPDNTEEWHILLNSGLEVEYTSDPEHVTPFLRDDESLKEWVDRQLIPESVEGLVSEAIAYVFNHLPATEHLNSDVYKDRLLALFTGDQLERFCSAYIVSSLESITPYADAAELEIAQYEDRALESAWFFNNAIFDRLPQKESERFSKHRFDTKYWGTFLPRYYVADKPNEEGEFEQYYGFVSYKQKKPFSEEAQAAFDAALLDLGADFMDFEQAQGLLERIVFNDEENVFKVNDGQRLAELTDLLLSDVRCESWLKYLFTQGLAKTLEKRIGRIQKVAQYVAKEKRAYCDAVGEVINNKIQVHFFSLLEKEVRQQGSLEIARVSFFDEGEKHADEVKKISKDRFGKNLLTPVGYDVHLTAEFFYDPTKDLMGIVNPENLPRTPSSKSVPLEYLWLKQTSSDEERGGVESIKYRKVEKGVRRRYQWQDIHGETEKIFALFTSMKLVSLKGNAVLEWWPQIKNVQSMAARLLREDSLESFLNLLNGLSVGGLQEEVVLNDGQTVTVWHQFVINGEHSAGDEHVPHERWKKHVWGWAGSHNEDQNSRSQS